MKFFILLSVVAAATAARLDNAIYLPPNAGSSAGHNAGLEPPHSADQHQHSQNLQQGGGGNTAEILKYDNEITDEGYHYAYETSDGTKAEQQGRVIPGAQPEEGSLQVSGSYSYVGDDGQTYSVTYTADENGFRAEGAHLPTPPPIPAEILESLKLTDRRSEDQYSSSKSSYDADAGY